MTQPTPRKATWRMGVRERYRLQWTVVALICIMLALAFRPYFLGLIQTRDFQSCQTNMHKIQGAISIYARDWDDAVPLASNWSDAVEGNMAATSGTGFSASRYFHCPRDHSNQPCSYVYNTLFSGLAITVLPNDGKARSRMEQLGRMDRAPLVIEKYGVERNTSLPIANWDDMRKEMDTPHELPEPTGSFIRGSLTVDRIDREKLAVLEGKRF